MTKSSTQVAGIDTGKATLDVALSEGGAVFQVGNDPAGWHELADRLRAAGVGRAGIEASGGYEAGVVGALREAGIEVEVYQPAQVRLYARLTLRHAKTDRLDAVLIAAFTAQYHADRLPADPRLAALATQLGYIEQVEADIVRLKTRLEQQREPRLRAMIEADIQTFRARRKAERHRLEADLRQHPDLCRRLDLVLSIPGLGRPTALALVIRLPELGQLDRQQIAALAGLAPFNHDSGKMHGARHIAGGRTRVRTALFAAALPAAFRWNPALVRLYSRLIANGKPHKLALIACARKLLIFANTVLARNTPWIQQS